MAASGGSWVRGKFRSAKRKKTIQRRAEGRAMKRAMNDPKAVGLRMLDNLMRR